MKARFSFALVSIGIALLADHVGSQPVKLWEVKVSSTQYKMLALHASGHDGSALFNGYTPLDVNARGMFWVSSDGKQVTDITDAFPEAGQVIFLTSQQLLIRAEAVLLGVPVPGDLTFLSRSNGVMVRKVFAVPGTFVQRGFTRYFYSQPVVFYSTRTGSDGSYVTQWTFQGLSRPTTLDLRAGSDGQLVLSASSPNAADIERSDDLKTWSLLTNFVGQAEVSMQPHLKSHEMFRVR